MIGVPVLNLKPQMTVTAKSTSSGVSPDYIQGDTASLLITRAKLDTAYNDRSLRGEPNQIPHPALKNGDYRHTSNEPQIRTYTN